MPTGIKPKWSSPAALPISLGSLASSTSGSGRQSTMVDNSTNRYKRILVWGQIKLGTSPSSNAPVTIYSLQGNQDGTPIRTDGAGASDAALTVKNADPVAIMTTGPSASTGDVLRVRCVIENPGPEWGVAVVQASGVALDSTGGNHVLSWIGEFAEIQN